MPKTTLFKYWVRYLERAVHLWLYGFDLWWDGRWRGGSPKTSSWTAGQVWAYLVIICRGQETSDGYTTELTLQEEESEELESEIKALGKTLVESCSKQEKNVTFKQAMDDAVATKVIFEKRVLNLTQTLSRQWLLILWDYKRVTPTWAAWRDHIIFRKRRRKKQSINVTKSKLAYNSCTADSRNSSLYSLVCRVRSSSRMLNSRKIVTSHQAFTSKFWACVHHSEESSEGTGSVILGLYVWEDRAGCQYSQLSVTMLSSGGRVWTGWVMLKQQRSLQRPMWLELRQTFLSLLSAILQKLMRREVTGTVKSSPSSTLIASVHSSNWYFMQW